MEQKYRCIETFSFPNDFNEAPENSTVTVIKGTIWTVGEENYCDGEIHLDTNDGLTWIEIDHEMFKKYFSKVEDAL